MLATHSGIHVRVATGAMAGIDQFRSLIRLRVSIRSCQKLPLDHQGVCSYHCVPVSSKACVPRQHHWHKFVVVLAKSAIVFKLRIRRS